MPNYFPQKSNQGGKLYKFLNIFSMTVLVINMSLSGVFFVAPAPAVAIIDPSCGSFWAEGTFDTTPDGYSNWSSGNPENGKWEIDNSGHTGKAARVKGDNNSTKYLYDNISTAGKKDMVLSYWFKSSDLEGGDNVTVDWSSDNGAHWTNLFTIDNITDESSWTLKSHNLPLNVNKIRFKADMHSGSRKVWLDDISIYGCAIPACTDADGDRYIVESTAIGSCGNVCGAAKNQSCLGNNDCNDSNISSWRIGSFFYDGDADGYYFNSPNAGPDGKISICYGANIPTGYTADCGLTADCNDDNAGIHSGATEICGDGIDQDCNGSDLECSCADKDSDGVCDKDDNCISVANSDQADADGDKIGNSCDNCTNNANTDQADSDIDLIGDVCDNCALTPNTNQADSDSDGIGDACAIDDDCLIFEACIDGRDSVKVENNNLSMTHYDYSAIGSADNCSTEWVNIIKVNGSRYPITLDGSQYYINGNQNLGVGIGTLDSVEKIDGRGAVSKDGLSAYLDDNDFGGGSVYKIKICGIDVPVCEESEEICDQKDNDCDDKIDEGGVCEQVCSTGPVSILNGGFEAPVVSANSGQWEVFPSGTENLGWNITWVNDVDGDPDPALLELQTTGLGWTGEEGSQWAELDSDYGYDDNEKGSVNISQSINTIAGAKYKVSFKFSARPNTDEDDNSLKVLFGTIDQTVSLPSVSDTNWTEYSYETVADGTVTVLQFTDMGNADTYGTLLDDVRVELIECPGPTTGTLTIVKSAENAGDMLFDFTGSLGAFSLAAGGSKTVNDVTPGIDYFVNEVVPEGWDTPAIDCKGTGWNGQSAISLGGHEIAVNLQAGSDVTCTFTNVKKEEEGTITVCKYEVANQIGNCNADETPADYAVYKNGYYWAWASPCSGGCSSIEPIKVPGWRYATEEEWALRPDVTDFGTPDNFKCASTYFDNTWTHCDYYDGQSGYLTRIPDNGSNETWLIYDCSEVEKNILVKAVSFLGELFGVESVNADLPGTPLAGWTINATSTGDNLYSESKVTGDDGCTTFTVPYGNYRITETMKPGWSQVYPGGNEYFDVNVNIENKNVQQYFSNKYTPGCGNGAMDEGEACDDGNTVDGDGCSANCTIEATCGDGIVNQDSEQCDSGENNGSCPSSCNEDCQANQCGGPEPYCGDGSCNGDESCSTCSQDCGSCGGGIPLCAITGGCNIFTSSQTTTQTNPVETPIVLGEEGEPVLEIKKAVSKNIVNPGDTGIEYTITVKNTGNMAAYAVEVTDVLPAGLQNANDNNSTMVWKLGDLAAGAEKVINYKVNVAKDAKAGDYKNIATAQATNHEAISASATLKVQNVAVLAATGFNYYELMLLIGLSSAFYAASKGIRRISTLK